MNQTKVTTKEKIIELAEKLFQTHGYNGFSYNDISSVLGIKNAAVHYYFPTKEDLGAAIILKASESFALWREQQEQNSDYWQKLQEFISLYFGQNLKDAQRICLVTSCAVVYHTLPESIKTEVRMFSHEVYHWLTNTLKEGKSQHCFDYKGEAADEAAAIISGLSAALQLARIEGDEFYHKVTHQLIRELKP